LLPAEFYSVPVRRDRTKIGGPQKNLAPLNHSFLPLLLSSVLFTGQICLDEKITGETQKRLDLPGLICLDMFDATLNGVEEEDQEVF
jgi:hypothetical protein